MSATVALPIVALALMISVVAKLPRVNVRNRGLAMIRVLIPSWRFFDDIAPTPVLQARAGSADMPWGAWESVLEPPRRTLRDVVWNPEGNLLLACQALVERLQSDLADFDENSDERADEMMSYQLVLNLVRCALAPKWSVGSGVRVQFKLVERDEGAKGTPSDLMLSMEHEL